MALVSIPLTDEILDAANHLPVGATLVVPEVSWDDYERLLAAFGDRGDLRVSYDSGRLEIKSPSNRHGRCSFSFDRLVSEIARIRKIDIEGLGNTTWWRRALEKGVEADCCYFVKNAKDVIGNEGVEVQSALAPDIAVEIDITNASLGKLSIYAALGVPEIWRYDGRLLHIHELVEGSYVEVDESRMLSGLTSSLLTEYLELTKAKGQTKALQKFTRRLSRKRQL
jgi:Uma2 family endonuclease